MRKPKRSISKAKTYGFHPWKDQIDSIDQIVKDSGVRESIVLRKLVDEALIARHRKIADKELGIAESADSGAEAPHSIRTLLIKLVRQMETSLRVDEIGLALLQDMFAETRAGRKAAWEQVASSLKKKGMNSAEISKRFEAETEQARDFAYSAAQEIRNQQKK